jgi:serine/threonine protein kinase
MPYDIADLFTDVEYAVKKETFTVDAMVAEVKLWVGLHHTNILPLSGVVYDRSSGLLMATVCPLATGGNLLEFGRKPGALTLPLLKKFAREMFMALHYLHSQSPPIVHCNPNSTNWLVFESGSGEPSVKLGDFVSARSLSGGGPWRLPWSSRLCTAPEWIDKEHDIVVTCPAEAFAIDVYAVGATMCQLVDESLRGNVDSKEWAFDKPGWLSDVLGYLRSMDSTVDFGDVIASTVHDDPSARFTGVSKVIGADLGKLYDDALAATPPHHSAESSLGVTVTETVEADSGTSSARHTAVLSGYRMPMVAVLLCGVWACDEYLAASVACFVTGWSVKSSSWSR